MGGFWQAFCSFLTALVVFTFLLFEHTNIYTANEREFDYQSAHGVLYHGVKFQ